MQENKISLCSNCKNGYDALKLDPVAPFCPYILCHSNEEKCKMYIPIKAGYEAEKSN